ncbi:TMEM43 family protein [Leptospira sp. GIMC2001]|uniref:TMEM43 family protein n=1 Tax=Leptospira sp. GIMC2001 TaxID=1513297 RepID=UPI00234943C0|nr:TMEM43 family protein [Leptospira sp. GIMC2001]WCL47758.1 TMEM43 family protein [Leptospira sp. GIMC2001]
MANEPYTEVTSKNYGQRLTESIKGVLTGAVLFIAAFPVLWMNEGCSVKTAKGLDQGASEVVEIDISKASNEYNGKLIHGSGMATTTENVSDPTFGISLNGFRLDRKVEMYQWKENAETKKEEKIGGTETTTTTYTYSKDWSSTLINSNGFKDPAARSRNANPSTMPYKSEDWSVKSAKVGDYKISAGLISQINEEVSVDYTNAATSKIPADIKSRANVSSNEIYIGKPSDPQIGDIRVSHTAVLPQEVSILGKLNNGQVGPFKTDQGTTIEHLTEGVHTAQEMFQAAQDANVFQTWIVRFVGFFMFFTGLKMILGPIATMGVVLPVLGNLLSMGLGLICGIISFVLTILVIALAWIFYRPLLGIALLAVVAAGGYFLYMKKKETAAKAAASGSGAAPSTQAG